MFLDPPGESLRVASTVSWYSKFSPDPDRLTIASVPFLVGIAPRPRCHRLQRVLAETIASRIGERPIPSRCCPNHCQACLDLLFRFGKSWTWTPVYMNIRAGTRRTRASAHRFLRVRALHKTRASAHRALLCPIPYHTLPPFQPQTVYTLGRWPHAAIGTRWCVLHWGGGSSALTATCVSYTRLRPLRDWVHPYLLVLVQCVQLSRTRWLCIYALPARSGR